jgi:hypothetical protein
VLCSFRKAPLAVIIRNAGQVNVRVQQVGMAAALSGQRSPHYGSMHRVDEAERAKGHPGEFLALALNDARRQRA